MSKTENAESHASSGNAPSFNTQEHDAEKPSQPKSPGNDAPDGGFAAWLVVLGVWCTSSCSFGWLNSKCDLVSPYIQATDSH